jgi:AcrR family transcriptional regulator
MIAESGNANAVTLRGVARRVGVAAPSIYRHFADIEELKLAVVDRAFRNFAGERDRAKETIDDPVKALLAGCRAYCRFAIKNPGPYRFMFSHVSPAQGRQSPAGLAAHESIAESIRRLAASGEADVDDPHKAAASCWAALHGLVLLRLNAPEFPWPASLEEMAEDVVIRLLKIDTNR